MIRAGGKLSTGFPSEALVELRIVIFYLSMHLSRKKKRNFQKNIKMPSATKNASRMSTDISVCSKDGRQRTRSFGDQTSFLYSIFSYHDDFVIRKHNLTQKVTKKLGVLGTDFTDIPVQKTMKNYEIR